MYHNVQNLQMQQKKYIYSKMDSRRQEPYF
jgi:hypothetical protein